MSEYIPYPDLDNKNFYKKIYHKKEFYDTKVDKLPDPSNQSDEILHSIFQEDKDFKLQKGQIFLRNFISELTPYNGILIFPPISNLLFIPDIVPIPTFPVL